QIDTDPKCKTKTDTPTTPGSTDGPKTHATGGPGFLMPRPNPLPHDHLPQASIRRCGWEKGEHDGPVGPKNNALYTCDSRECKEQTPCLDNQFCYACGTIDAKCAADGQATMNCWGNNQQFPTWWQFGTCMDKPKSVGYLLSSPMYCSDQNNSSQIMSAD